MADNKNANVVMMSDIKPLKSKYRLDWIWTKLRIGNVYPFPLATILLIGLPLLFLIPSATGLRVPLSLAQVPGLKVIFNYMGIYSDRGLMVVGTWVLWWPLFIITIFIFKRIWCGGFCPFGLTTDIGNWFGKKFRRGKKPMPINITKYIFIGFLVFKALGYLHDAINITNSVVLSVEFVIFFIVYAFIIGMIAPRRSFCRLFCFLGALPHLFGRLSIYTLEVDKSKCEKCEGHWCMNGYKAAPYGVAPQREPLINVDGCPMFIDIPNLSHKEPNRNCILCGNCIKNCPHDAIHYKPKVPGYELYKGIDLNMHETVFVLGLIPLLGMFMAMEGGLLGKFATMIQFHETAHWLITLTFYAVSTALFCLVYYIVSGMSSTAMGTSFKRGLTNFGYIYLPFGYLAFVRDILITYALKGSFLPSKFIWMDLVYPFLDFSLIFLGVAWSMYMAYKIGRVTMEQEELEVNNQKVMIHTYLHSALALGLGYYWIKLAVGEYLGTLSSYDVHYAWPFVVAIACVVLLYLGIKNKTTLARLFGFTEDTQ